MTPAAKTPVSVIILTHNNEGVIGRAMKSALWAGEILILDHGSTDQTAKIAQDLGGKVIDCQEVSFADKRNIGLKQAVYDWLFYLDSDETITPALREELIQIIESDARGVYSVRRKNFFLGREMYPDWVERLFYKERLKKWAGRVHEHPEYRGEVIQLKHGLIHQTHTDISSMLSKTNRWSETEAELRLDAGHPPVAWWRLIRIAATVWWQQLVKLKVYKYGREGWFEGYFQMVDKLIVYTKLWEKQHGS